MNTARMHSIATNRGNVVSAVASLAARARLRRSARRVWMFSIVTVISSTRMPTASAKPPNGAAMTAINSEIGRRNANDTKFIVSPQPIAVPEGERARLNDTSSKDLRG